MLRTLSEREHNSVAKQLSPTLRPVGVLRRSGEMPQIAFANGETGVGSCLRCPTPPCMTFSEDDLAPRGMPEFAYDREDSVCPTMATV